VSRQIDKQSSYIASAFEDLIKHEFVERRFLLFALLPTEVRLCIWKFALDSVSPQLHDVSNQERSKSIYATLKPSSLLSTCQESRQLAQKTYRLVKTDGGGIIAFNSDKDAICWTPQPLILNTTDCWRDIQCPQEIRQHCVYQRISSFEIALHRAFGNLGCVEVKHLVLGQTFLEQACSHRNYAIAEYLKMWTSLESVFVVPDQKNSFSGTEVVMNAQTKGEVEAERLFNSNILPYIDDVVRKIRVQQPMFNFPPTKFGIWHKLSENESL
jgi:hypothetical protein